MQRELVGEFSIQDNWAGKRVDALLYHGVTGTNLQDFECKWRPEFERRKQRALQLNDAEWRDEDAHWDWRDKHRAFDGRLDKAGFVLEVNGCTEGLLYCDLDVRRTSRICVSDQRGLVYVDYIATAPWNRVHPDGRANRLRGGGSVLMSAAIALSLNEELDGRIGLHALPHAEAFYAQCGMSDLGPDANYQDLRYFEMLPENAQAFMQRTGTARRDR